MSRKSIYKPPVIERCPECHLLGAHHHSCSRPGRQDCTPIAPIAPIARKEYYLRSASLWIKQILVACCAFGGAVVANVGFHWISDGTTVDRVFSWLFPTVGIAIATTAATGVWRIRRQRQKLRNDFDQQHGLSETSSFVLYLRSFRDDETKSPKYAQEFLPSHRTNEQWVVEELSKRHPGCLRFAVLAVGKPDEELPPLGCTRYRFNNEEWERKVENLMHKASAVLLRPGTTPAVLWETQRLVLILPPQRVYVLARPYGDHAAAGYKQWREVAATLFPNPLPQAEEAGFLMGFDDGWQPTYSGLNEEPRLQRLTSQGVAPSIEWMLKRVTRLPRCEMPPPLPFSSSAAERGEPRLS